MFIPLATTLNPQRAHIAAGVLQAHGIPAWIWQDLSSGNYAALATGGYQLVIDAGDLTDAIEVLNTLPPPLTEVSDEPPARAPHFSPGEAVLTGMVTGAWVLPLIAFGLTLIAVLLTTLTNLREHSRTPVLSIGQLRAFPFQLFLTSILGIGLGAAGGVTVWLFAAWRYRHPVAVVFVSVIAFIIII